MARYDAHIDLANTNLSHSQVVDLVGFSKTVLDVGCAGGDVARALVEQRCRVSGVEIDAEAAEKARPLLDQLVIADLNTSLLSEYFKPASFDAIIFADVLEHLLHPERVLEDSLSLLAPHGRVIVSIPNIAHGAVRLALMQGRWRYTETGLLDATHVRFFTRESFVGLLRGAGLVIEDLRSTVADPLATEVRVDGDRIPASVVEWVRDQADSFNYQFVAAARMAGVDEAVPEVPELVPASPVEQVRPADRHALEHSQHVREDQEIRHRLLTVRDHIIGLEVSAASAEERLAKAEGRAKLAMQRASRLRQRVTKAEQRAKRAKVQLARAQVRARKARRAAAQLRGELNDVKRSRSWRVGRMVTSPMRIGRGGGKGA